jgi:hypothetical protein
VPHLGKLGPSPRPLLVAAFTTLQATATAQNEKSPTFMVDTHISDKNNISSR